MNRSEVFSILRGRYPENGYAIMEEVSDKAGFDRSRSADFMVMSLWPSRGLALSGIELKSFRSDWLSELKRPEKAENIFQYCDHFWLLTTDESIAKLEEIPISWGWMCIKGNRIFVKKEAPALSPHPISKSFLAALLKRASTKEGWIRKDEIKDQIKQAEEYGNQQNKTSQIQNEYDRLKEKVKEFEKYSGIDIEHTWGSDIEKIGEAVKFIRQGSYERLKDDLMELEKTAQDITNRISQGLKTIPCSSPTKESE